MRFLPSFVVFAVLLLVLGFADRNQIQALIQDRHDTAEAILIDAQMQIDGFVSTALRSSRQLASKIDPSIDIDQDAFETLVKENVNLSAELARVELAPEFVTRLVYPLQGNESFIGKSPLHQAEGTPEDIARQAARGYPALSRISVTSDGRGELNVSAEMRKAEGTNVIAAGMVHLVAQFDVSLSSLAGFVPIGEVEFYYTFHPAGTPMPKLPQDWQTEGNREPHLVTAQYPPGDFLLLLRPVNGWRPSAAELMENRLLMVGLGLLLLLPVGLANWFAISHGQARNSLSRTKSDIDVMLRNLPGAALSITVPAGKDRPSPTDKIRFLNPQSCKEIWGIDADVFERDPTMFFQTVTSPEAAERLLAAITNSMRDLQPLFEVWPIETPEGEQKWLLGRGYPTRLSDGSTLWSAIIFDNTQQTEHQNELQKSETRVAQSAKLAGLGYAIIDVIAGQVQECDETYADMHGLKAEDFTSGDINREIMAKLVHPDDRPKTLEIRERIANGETVIGELRHVLPNGEIRTLRKIFSPIQPNGKLCEIVGQDVTETRALQDKLFQSQKVDAIGKLTGGVAHDFNNLLAVTLGNLELLSDTDLNPDQKDLIKNSIEATLRGADLTRNMLSFARQAPLEPTNVNLNQLVQNMHNWIVRTLPSTIEIETSLNDGLWATEADASSVEAGLLNLILNARDAMPEGGKLSISTSNVEVDKDRSGSEENVASGRYVLLEVTDTGEGISPENEKHIFEPFFTTKPVGSGTGLGLSMLEGFMQQSKGAIRVFSEQGAGTTFKLYFATTTTASTAASIRDQDLPFGDADTCATILLVEDNVEVLAAINAILVQSGYRIIQASSGDEAYEVFQIHPEIDVLLTDIVMPGELQGTTLAKALRELDDDLPVVFMSGYASEATVHGNGLRPHDTRLMKPVRRDDLLRAVRKALSQKNEPENS